MTTDDPGPARAAWPPLPFEEWRDTCTYAAVRASDDPEGDLKAFLESTYEAAAELAGWDREALEMRERYPPY